jgi:hypothetical protein
MSNRLFAILVIFVSLEVISPPTARRRNAEVSQREEERGLSRPLSAPTLRFGGVCGGEVVAVF